MRLKILVFILPLLTAGIASAQEELSLMSSHWEKKQKRRTENFIVNKIHIEALDAFDPKIPEYRSWVFRFLNKLHNKTNESFIRRELLFRTGDIVDDDILEESERNLRLQNFLGDVSIERRQVGADKMDIYVNTEDQWTLQFNLSAGTTAGYSTFEFGVEESNFLGLGKTVGFEYERDQIRTTFDVLYYDPQFFNSRWNFQTNFQTASDGWRYTTDVVRPFYSLETKWAYGASWDSGTYTTPLHHKGKAAAEIDTDHRTGLFFLARAWGERDNKRRFGAVFSADSLLFPNPARIIIPEYANVKSIRRNLHPVDRESYQYGAMFKWDRQTFIKETYLDNFGRIEDLPKGMQVGSMLTRAENTDLNTDFYQLYSMGQYSAQFTPAQYFVLFGEFSGRRQTDGVVNNLYLNAYAHYYLKMNRFSLGGITFPRQTLAANLSTVLTRDVDAPFLIGLGENEGLRGYTFKSFTGQNKVLFNIEDRIFTPWDFRLVGIGLVAFLDAGYVWSSDEHLKFNDLGVSAGLGLRIGLKKSTSSKVVRIDFAIPLRDETSRFTLADRRGYSISISSGQIFSAIEQLPRLFQLF
jgi:hypothetical protein